MRLRNDRNAPDYLKSQTKYIINDHSLIKKDLSKLFDNNNELIYIEIGMGKGDFIVNQAIKNPHINFIGLEKFETVIVKAHKKAMKHDLNNLKMIAYDANQINELFNDYSIDKIFLNFSDPWPKKRHERKRLTNPEFLEKFKKILKPNSLIEFKTDNEKLFNYTITDVLVPNIDKYEILFLTYNLYELKDEPQYLNNIQTEYEKKFSSLGERIKKVIFRFI